MEISLSEPSMSWVFRLKINEREPLLIDCLPVMLVLPPLLLLSSFFPAFSLLCPWDGCLSRVLDEDFYKQPFSELIGYVYVAPTNILPLRLISFFVLFTVYSQPFILRRSYPSRCHVLINVFTFFLKGYSNFNASFSL